MRALVLMFLRLPIAMVAAVLAMAPIYRLLPNLRLFRGTAALVALFVGLGAVAALLVFDRVRKPPAE
jgi:hypothetical protein